jgi:ketosteroid isomerase-like protein
MKEKMMTPSSNASTDEAQVRARMEAWATALRAKDLDGLMAHYAEDILVFDLAPPLQYEGKAAYRKNWGDWFPSFQGPVGYEIRGLSIATGGDLAFCRSLNRISGIRTSGEKTDVWVRATVGLRKIGGKWMVAHEHFSVPINMETFAAELELEP